jgi:VWFA-related protein
MTSLRFLRVATVAALVLALVFAAISRSTVSAQSGRQPTKKGEVEKKTDVQKREDKGKPDDKAKVDEQDPLPPPVPKGQKDEPSLKLSTQVVGIQVSVIDKKTGRLSPGLKKKNFTIYEDGVKQEISNFAPGEGPATVVLLLDNNFRNRRYTSYYDPNFAQEIFRSAAGFAQMFVKPKDFVGVVTFSMKPKVVQDFTNDSQRLYSAIVSAYRDTLNFSESNIYDGLAFTLLGGKAYQLYAENAGEQEYGGLQEVEGNTAIILITLGIDTFSKITYDKALKIVANGGVPVYTIGVGNLFFKKYEQYLSPETRLDFLQAVNQLRSFADRSGGSYFEMTFESQIPQIMQSIEALVRNQYDLGYVPTNTRREGKERKIKVEVDLDNDGQPDLKSVEIRHRNRYYEPDDKPKTK